MRVFTDAEKQQLQSKIKDEQERQRVLKEIVQVESEKEAKRRRGLISTVLSYRYVLLGFLLFMLIGYVILMPPWQNRGYHIYLGHIVLLMVLFNHIAWNFTKRGRPSRVMKTIAWIWMIFVLAYLFWFFRTGIV